MFTKEKLRAWFAIQKIALYTGKAADVVRRDMQAVIDDAWTAAEAAGTEVQLQMFPKGKPTLEAFVTDLAKRI